MNGSNDYVGDERGLSDVIGFVLTFATIIGAVAIVSTFGFSILQDVQTNEQQTNAERAFEVLGENFEDIEQGTGPRRSGELNLYSGQLAVKDESEFLVQVTNASGATSSELIRPQELRYTEENTRLAYEGGAVFRYDDGGSILKRPPEILCRGDVAVVSFVSLAANAESRQLSGGTAQVIGTLNETETHYPINRTGPQSVTDVQDVTITINTSPHTAAWGDYLNSTDWEALGSNQYQCSNVDRVYVRQTDIDLTFTR